MEHFEESQALWEKYVPAEAQANTRHGELVRAVEKLRHETMTNGNRNWVTLPDDEEPYHRLQDRIVEWTRAHPEPIPHEHIQEPDR